MALTRGTRLGSYEILAAIGAGGMGEVYRARDRKLDRDVAIKILPEALAADPERIARFEREAKTLASLNHPNIAHIHGLEDAGGVRALVMELVEGEDLAQRLTRGAIPLEEALPIARQIADALDAAHEKGIVHRDLKPSNIAITRGGAVKVLDFGLAKVMRVTEDIAASSQSPTLTLAGTRDGMILGTAAYMSPEQTRGQVVDTRTDIWAFGCVLYEMLTGHSAFHGDTVSDTIAAILTRDADWDALPSDTPAAVRLLLQRCLEKDPHERLRDIGDARAELLGPRAANDQRDSRKTTQRNRSLVSIGGAAAALVAVATAVGLYFRMLEPAQVARLSLFSPGQITAQLSATISPDGRRVAFVSTDASGKSLLWIRPLDATDARPLSGTEDAAHPFWSPDGQSLGFLAQGKLKTVAAAGGPIQTLANAPVRAGASWSRAGVILFIPRPGELATIPAAGGAVSPVINAETSRPFGIPVWPFFLPDGRHFLFYAGRAAEERRGIYAASLDAPAITRVLVSDFKGAYAPPGFLFFVRDETLMAQPFDPKRLELRGEPAPIAAGVWTAALAAQASYSVSPTAVAYVNASLSNRQLAWFDRRGKSLGTIGKADRYLATPELNHEGSRIAIAYRGHIRLLDADDGTTSRFTFGPGPDRTPQWSPDGKQIAYSSPSRDGRRVRIVVKSSSDAASEEPLVELPAEADLQDWSPDGRFLVYGLPGKTGLDLWTLPLTGDRTPVPFLQSGFNHAQSRISPDGRWIAYTSNESGGDEVYVESFPKPGSKRQVSDHGGVAPRWGRNGAELFYLAGDQYLTSVPILQARTFEVGRATALFRARVVVQGSQSTGLTAPYDVTGDGQRVVLLVAPEDPEPPMTVVLNWMSALKK